MQIAYTIPLFATTGIFSRKLTKKLGDENLFNRLALFF